MGVCTTVTSAGPSVSPVTVITPLPVNITVINVIHRVSVRL